jgi:hypothetical protein
MPLQYTKPSPSELHAEPHHSHGIEDPLSAESYKENKVVTTRLYRDLRYMTLDHEAGYLYGEYPNMVTGNIKFPPAERKGNVSLKAIAM